MTNCLEQKHISIELLRVSNDSKYIELIFDVPQGYHMTSIQINALYLERCSDRKLSSEIYEFSDSVFTNKTQSQWTLKIPVECLGNHIPAMYYITFNGQMNPEDAQLLSGYSPDLEDVGMCSDVNGVYNLLFDSITKPGQCDPLSDDAIRNYMLLYGHQAAMSEGDLDTAKYFFRFIAKNFANCCTPEPRCSGAKSGTKSSCGCRNAEPVKVKPNLCGCKNG